MINLEKTTFNQILKLLSTKPRPKINSSGLVDCEIFGKLSHLYYENNKQYTTLKEIATANTSHKKPITYLLTAYFHYIDCQFRKALNSFKEFLKSNKSDLEATLGMAFCYRQLGDYNEFDKIICCACNKKKIK